MAEDPALRRYRRILAAFLAVACVAVAYIGFTLLLGGKVFPAFLCLCAMGFFVLLIVGYRQDERERNP